MKDSSVLGVWGLSPAKLWIGMVPTAGQRPEPTGSVVRPKEECVCFFGGLVSSRGLLEVFVWVLVCFGFVSFLFF